MAPSISNPNSTSNRSPSLCKHSPSATLDILILILVLISCTFLITSYFNYIIQSLSLILPPLSIIFRRFTDLVNEYHVLYSIGIVSLFIVFVFVSFEIWIAFRSNKCGKSRCKGLRNAMEFDLQVQTDECLRSGVKAVREIDRLPWKGGDESNPDYERFRDELRRMAPPNGRAVLLFRSRCGCSVAKLEGWGSKRSRRSKK
ncbi:uncharacterized protein At5g19025-like [Impatiens glandulifera]|uniref:uncharacterized protein At5g19025-like n=1 Tax=Impatiens glandulifera TaxID=253017 RepID=UPI001FB10EAA|nr:uncharacterized protein At5g19025-like [Impatiens glandulifera]